MRRKLFFIAITILFIIVFADYTGLMPAFYHSEEIYNSMGTFSGNIIKIKEYSKEKAVVVAELDNYYDKVLLTLYDCRFTPKTLWKAEIQFEGIISKPQGRRNPGCFDYSLHLKSERITGVVSAKNFQLKKMRENHIENILIGKRFDYINSLSYESKGIISGILFGDKNYLSEDVYEQFRENGTAHILAVSGLHVSILYSLIRKLTSNNPSAVSLCLTTIILLLYSFLSLWSFSAVRATAMILMKEWGRYYDRNYDLLTSASAVSIIFMLKNPYIVYNVGFQMSLIAVISIAFFLRLFPTKIPDSASMMLAVNIGLIPYQAYQFNLLSISSFIANIPIIYIAGVLLPFALAHFVLFFITGNGLLLEIIVDALSSFIVLINGFLTMGNFGHFDIISIPLWMLIFIYLSMFYVASESFEIACLRKKIKLIFQCEIAILIAAVIIGGFSHNDLNNADVLFLDVGQGDCVHIKTDSKDILIDGGGSADYAVGTKTVKPYLLKNGVSKIDLALVTHLHTDHYKGLKELKAENMIKKLMSGQTSGKSFQISKNVKIKTIWPLDISDDLLQDENKNCSVFMVYYNLYKILITGDLDSEGEKKMLDYYKGSNILEADILKIGHHGSKYSTCDEFIEAVNPTFAVIQVGKNNYGHPNSKVIEKCEEKGIIVFRNDTHGCVGFSLSGDNITYGLQSNQN